VTGRRDDGYHELDSVFLPVTLADRVTVEVRSASESAVTARCNLAALPADERNLAVRAARAFLAEYRITAQVGVELEKAIPMGAGLGGGSSDAGAVLRMLGAMTRIPVDARLQKLALSLGADVPFFLAPAPARVRGVGERIAPLGGVPRFPLVIAVPQVEVATAAVYRNLKPVQWSGPAPDAAETAIQERRLTQALAVNDLAEPAIAMFPQIEQLRSMLAEQGAAVAQMSGSGGAVFGIFDQPQSAHRAAAELRERVRDTTVLTCETLASGERPG
ncbi:MAG TPA: 4-(cytidine 5'-diphospho)-2-C-methyl-D-erythritol kinase, partial [Candidatus Binataceae bacterium]|nr:4-(cytidine 5'-diphospho)-2-C-methyl-D-erythritol kinase [Candidatus Binataceae bacterium]